MRIVETITISRDKLTTDYDAAEVCHLPSLSYAATGFDMPDARRDALVVAGRTAAKHHLSGARVFRRPPHRPPLWALGPQLARRDDHSAA